jgi:hypothetical protein
VEVVATRGDGIFLLKTRAGRGMVLNMEKDPPQVSAERSLDLQLKSGGWEAYEGDPEPVLEVAAVAVPVSERDQRLIDRGFTLRRSQGSKITIGPHAKQIVGEVPESRRPTSPGRGWFTVAGTLDSDSVTVTWTSEGLTGDARAVAHIHQYVAAGTVFEAAVPSAFEAALSPEWLAYLTVLNALDEGATVVEGKPDDPPWFSDPPGTIY